LEVVNGPAHEPEEQSPHIGGKSDIIFYTINSFYLEQNLPNAQLILYPEAAHGSLFQYPELFIEHTSLCLRG
jgi:hypothetical protein